MNSIDSYHDRGTGAAALAGQYLIDGFATAVSLGQATRAGRLLEEITTLIRLILPAPLTPQAPPRPGNPRYASPSRSLPDLLHIERALRPAASPTGADVTAWRLLSSTYSAIGMHTRAVSAAHHVARVCSRAGLPPGLGTIVSVRVRAAVAADHRGDAARAIRDLYNLIEYAHDVDMVLCARDQAFLRYAVHRLAVLGCSMNVDVEALGGNDPVVAHVNRLTDVCIALVTTEPRRAIALLDKVPVDRGILGDAELARLTSLARIRSGDLVRALRAERAALRATVAVDAQLHAWLVAGLSAQLAEDWLRDIAEHYSREAIICPSDPSKGEA